MDDWEADEVKSEEGRTAYMWIVPAKVAGAWKIDASGTGGRSYDVTFQQQYQKVSGTARADNKSVPLSNGKLRGDTITFTVADDTNTRRDFTGRVAGNKIEGTVKTGAGESKFTATRVGDAK
jgi:hypothetical protein